MTDMEPRNSCNDRTYHECEGTDVVVGHLLITRFDGASV